MYHKDSQLSNYGYHHIHFIEYTLKYNVQRLGKPTKNNLMFCCHDTNVKVSKEDIEGSL